MRKPSTQEIKTIMEENRRVYLSVRRKSKKDKQDLQLMRMFAALEFFASLAVESNDN